MPKVSSKQITDAILDYCEARELAGACRSVSAQLAAAAQLGCRCSGGAPPAPIEHKLLEAERPLALCTELERKLLVERYWYGGKVAIERRWGNRRQDYMRPVWQSYEVVAVKVGAPSVEAVRTRIQRARAKVRKMLEALR